MFYEYLFILSENLSSVHQGRSKLLIFESSNQTVHTITVHQTVVAACG